MRKYVVPIVALAGIALLSAPANAVDLLIKSRAIPAGKAGSLPIIVRGAPDTGLWGIDAGLTFSNAALTAGANAFTPNSKGASAYDATKDVAISGTTFVGTAPQPNVYFGYVRGATAISAPTTTQTPVGMLKLSVAAGTTAQTIINITATGYNVKNTGTDAGSAREGATAATVAANAVVSTPVVLVDALSQAATAVPMHKVAVGFPGDIIVSNGVINISDFAAVKGIAGGVAGSATEYRKIVADVAPAPGYTPGTDIFGTAGAGYGDGVVNVSDVASIKAKVGGVNPTFPVAE